MSFVRWNLTLPICDGPILLKCTVYWEILVVIKFGEMGRNRLDKYLKFGDSHDQIEDMM